jgi:hypothetical protein
MEYGGSTPFSTASVQDSQGELPSPQEDALTDTAN